MQDQLLHPSPKELSAFNLGQLSLQDAKAVEIHIGQCQPCCETLLGISSDDTFLALLQEADHAASGQTLDQDADSQAGSAAKVGEIPPQLVDHPRYAVVAPIGKGGMGDVFKAEHRMMERTVALKVIKRTLFRNSEAVQRFRREVKTAAKLSHPNIVTAYDAEQAGDIHFLVMEYVDGVDLARRVKEGGALSINEACHYIQQTARGLQHAHEQGMVHRDIKPHNLMVTGDGTVKILDFGLATLAEESITDEVSETCSDNTSEKSTTSRLTGIGTIMGTPDFISPEQANESHSVDIRSDIYSLGCTFYYLLAGRPPFENRSVMEKVKAHADLEAEPINNVRVDVPDEVADVVRRMMSKDPDQRFQTPAELADALAPFVDAQRTRPAPIVADYANAVSPSRRRWWPPTALQWLCLGAFALIAGTIIYVRTDGGTLVVESEDPSIEITVRPLSAESQQENVDRPEWRYRIGDMVTGSSVKWLRSGQYVLDLQGEDNDFELSQDRFILKRGDKVIVTVTRKPVGHAPEPETAGVQLQEVWPFSDLGEIDVLSISRNGLSCAFVDDTGGLTIRDLTTGNDQRVAEKAPDSDNWGQASISSDNYWVAYVGGDPDSEAGSDLRIVAIDGSGQRVLYPNKEKSTIQGLEWSPDGQHVLAAFYDAGGGRGDGTGSSVRIATVSFSDGSIKVLKTLGREEAHSPHPRLSPDGRYVAYGRMMDTESEQQDIFLIPLDGKPEVHLIEHLADDHVGGWTPDGKGLLFWSDRRGEGDDIWLLPLTDGKPADTPRQVKTSPADVDLEGPVRTPSGGWAFYYSHWEQATYEFKSTVHIAALDPKSGKLLPAPKQVTKPTVGKEVASSPDFSRDGRNLAYYVTPGPEYSREKMRYGPGNIVIRSLETGQEREILLSPIFKWTYSLLRWSPDGHSILVRGNDETGRNAIYRADVDTGKLTPLVLDEAHDWHPRSDGSEGDDVGVGEWSSDGKTLFYFRSHYDPKAQGKKRTQARIVARDLETGQEREVYRNPEGVGGMFGFNVSPDGQWVAIHAPWNITTALTIVPTAGGRPRELLQLQEPEHIRGPCGVAWMPDGRSLLCVKIKNERSELWRISVESGQGEHVGVLGRDISQLRVHPDGRQIAFGKGRLLRFPQHRIRMAQFVLSPERVKEGCIANLKTIGEAIERYKRDHDDVPDGLSDLYPEYLQDEGLLHCPGDNTSQVRPNSYRYLFGPSTRAVHWRNVSLPADLPAEEGWTWNDARKLQVKYYGGIVPSVVCRHHRRSLYLGYDGETFESEEGDWEKSHQAGVGLLTQLKTAMQSSPATWMQLYDTQRLVHLVEIAGGDRADVAKILETHIVQHPDDEAAKEFLAALPKLRFITRSEDDAEENAETGSTSLNSFDLELIKHDHDNDDFNQIVGVRFADVRISQGARIKRAYLQFTTSTYPMRASSEGTDLVIHAQREANAEPFTEVKHNISSRPKTATSVKWSPESWDVPGERSDKQRAPDLSSLIQEVVNQPDWQEGNALVLIISGTGQRTAESWDFSWSGVPMLYIDF